MYSMYHRALIVVSRGQQIAVFQEITIRRVWHNEEWCFDIVDVVGVLTDSVQPEGDPQAWIEGGRAWNEQYLLRAFLMHNSAYRIELFTSWLLNTRPAWFAAHLPQCRPDGGGQLWLRKLAR